MLAQLKHALSAHPYKSNVFVALFIFTCSDCVAQKTEDQYGCCRISNSAPPHLDLTESLGLPHWLDLHRTRDNLVWMALIYTPAFTFLYKRFDRLWPGASGLTAVKKVAGSWCTTIPHTVLFFGYGVTLPYVKGAKDWDGEQWKEEVRRAERRERSEAKPISSG